MKELPDAYPWAHFLTMDGEPVLKPDRHRPQLDTHVAAFWRDHWEQYDRQVDAKHRSLLEGRP